MKKKAKNQASMKGPETIAVYALDEALGTVTHLRGGVQKVRWTAERRVFELPAADAHDLVRLGGRHRYAEPGETPVNEQKES